MHPGVDPRKEKIKPSVLWFTGLSGAGKSTIADQLYSELKSLGVKVERLDGDAVRSMFPKLGFSKSERDDNVVRFGYLASILERNGIVAICSFISPYREPRNKVRSMCKNFVEIYVSTSLEECERRDVKGLYAKARRGEIENFTGVSDPYEPPQNAEIVINTKDVPLNEATKIILSYIENI